MNNYSACHYSVLQNKNRIIASLRPDWAEDWMTPIMWNIDGMELNPILITILKLNPMYYIVAGYRDSLINKAGFWEQPGMTIYYWILTIVLFIIGTKIFKKLKPHFADVL